MKKTYFVVFTVIVFMTVMLGCTAKTQITETINKFVDAYNARDAQGCMAVYILSEEDKEYQLDGARYDSLQHYFDVHPTTPTISSIEVTQVAYMGGMASAKVDYYCDDFQSAYGLSRKLVKVYRVDIRASDMPENTFCASFMLGETSPGFLGFYSTWKVMDVSGIEGVDIEPVIY